MAKNMGTLEGRRLCVRMRLMAFVVICQSMPSAGGAPLCACACDLRISLENRATC